MSDASFTLTFEFIHSVDYRVFLAHVRHLRSPHAPFLGVLIGMSRIFVRRNLTLREVTVTSGGAMSDVLFDLRQLIHPHTVIVKDFSIQGLKDYPAVEFKRCLHACVQSSAACFAHPEDPETYHQFRLSLRAFRSHLQIIRKIGVGGLNELRAKTKVLAKSSNELRDVDVRLELYEKFNEPIPGTLIKKRKQLLEEALYLLHSEGADSWLLALRTLAVIDKITDGTEQFAEYLAKQTKKAAKRWRKLDMKEDAAVHALRIKLKMLSYGFSAIEKKDEETVVRAKSIKAIQSRLGDVRDLRFFYRLPGLDAETRYLVVQKLSSLERELEEMEIR